MLKIYSLLIGEDPAYTATFHPSSKRKIALYASCMMIPVILWFFNGFFLVSHVLGGGVLSALLTAIVLAFLIYLIERAVIMAKGNNWLAGFRILLGLFIAVLGSVCLDEVIFKSDIDNKIVEYKQAILEKAKMEKDASYQATIMQQAEVVKQKDAAWRESLRDATGEADGTKGSGVARVGEIARLKLNVASMHEKEYLGENAKLQALQEELAQKKEEAAAQAEAAFNSNALLLRIKALFDLVAEDVFMLIIYIIFTGMLFLMEFLVVIVKLCTGKSIDEELEEARISLIRAKTQMTLEKSKQYFEPELADDRVKLARLALSQGIKGNLSSYN